jgi:hypothetical protein
VIKSALRFRFWLEIMLASGTAILLSITLVWNNWIELAFGLGPDNGSGWTEWFVVGLLLVATNSLFFLARCAWRRAQNEEYQYE